jgi:magnesium chelatase family protein
MGESFLANRLFCLSGMQDVMRICCSLRLHGCPCGYYTDPNKECTCAPPQIQRYLSRVSGPLLNSIDIQIKVPAVQYRHLAAESSGEKSEAIRARVQRAREIQQQRFSGSKHLFSNADMQPKDIPRYCKVND